MGQTTVTQFAGELKMPASVLLEQLQKAGVDKARETDLLSEQDKTRLLDFLRRAHGDTAAKSKITLTRKETSEIRATDSTGRARTVQVEVRKKRVLVKRDTPEATAEPVTDEEALSLATTQPRSRRPSTSGRMPYRSRAAYRLCSFMNTKQNAPASCGSSRIRRQSRRGLSNGDVSGTASAPSSARYACHRKRAGNCMSSAAAMPKTVNQFV